MEWEGGWGKKGRRQGMEVGREKREKGRESRRGKGREGLQMLGEKVGWREEEEGSKGRKEDGSREGGRRT